MGLPTSSVLSILACCVLVASASTAAPAKELRPHDALRHLIGPQPVINTGWLDATRESHGGWWFQLHVDADGKVTRSDLNSGRPEQLQEATRAVQSLRFTPFEVDGKPAPVQFEFLVNASNADYEGPADRRFPARVDPAQVSIALRRTGCYGTCPAYWVEVRGDGQVSYEGSGEVAVEGKHHWRVDPAAVARLVERFRKADYFRLQGAYTTDVIDSPSYTTRLSLGGQRKFVFNYAGEQLAKTGSPMPRGVTALENDIDAVTGVRGWVDGDARTMSRLRDAQWDFRSPAAGRGLNHQLDRCKLALAKDFIRAGAPVNIRSGAFEVPALLRAVHCGDVGLIRQLAAAGADLEAPTARGETALEITDREPIALALLDAGAKPPSDPVRLAALIRKAKEEKWKALLPRLLRAPGAREAQALSASD